MTALVWLFPIFSGVADAASRGVMKLTGVHRFTLMAFGHLFALPFYALWLVGAGMGEIQPLFWLVILVHVPLWAYINALTITAHRSSELARTAPYISLTPAFLLVVTPALAYLLALAGFALPFGWPAAAGYFGVFLLTAGVYFLNTRDNQVGFFAPFRWAITDRGSRLMLAAAALSSITATLDYVALVSASSITTASDYAALVKAAPFYLLVDHGLIAVISFAMMPLYVWSGRAARKDFSPTGSWTAFLLFGVVTATSVIFTMLGLAWIPYVPFVFAGKRMGMTLAAVAIGIAIASMPRFGDLYAAERKNLGWRVLGTLLMIIGMAVIVFWGRTP